MTSGGTVHLHIEARPGWRPVDFAELWRYRELLWFLALRDIQVRYKQTVIGVAWALVQPLMTMLVFTTFFGYLGGMNRRMEPGIPYPIYAFCALLPWQLFSFGLSQASASIVNGRALLTKVYFPRLLMPIVPLPCGLLDFSISFLVMLGLMAWFGKVPGLAVLTLPLFLFMAVAAALAVGLWLSALNALYRDVQHTLPFLLQIWMFATPIAYPSDIVPMHWRWLYGLNPMAGVVDGFRWALLGGSRPGSIVVGSLVMTLLLLSGGLYFFRRMERIFADVI